MAKTGLTEFVRQVRQETTKVTWSTRKETVVSTIMVLVMVLIASAFFMFTDFLIFNAIQVVLGF